MSWPIFGKKSGAEQNHLLPQQSQHPFYQACSHDTTSSQSTFFYANGFAVPVSTGHPYPNMRTKDGATEQIDEESLLPDFELNEESDPSDLEPPTLPFDSKNNYNSNRPASAYLQFIPQSLIHSLLEPEPNPPPAKSTSFCCTKTTICLGSTISILLVSLLLFATWYYDLAGRGIDFINNYGPPPTN